MANIPPPDLKACWFPLVRRFQSNARSGGLAILTMTVLVNQDGTPILWLEPKKTLIEPKANAGQILELLQKHA